MIRRNHIDNTSRVPRDTIRSRPHYNPYPTNINSPSTELSENRMRLTSNNKKYHQYKEERETKTRPFQHQAEMSDCEERPALADLSINKESRPDSQLRREYAYDPEDTLKIDYNSISLKTNEQRRSAHIAHQTQSNNLNLDRLTAPSPSGKASQFPTTNSGFMPLFEETTVAMKRRELQESRYGLGRIYQTSSKKTVKTEQEGVRTHQRRQTISEYTYMPPKPDFSQIPLPSKESPSIAGSLQKEEVSQKLRMISEFNDQINERIKNIIGCFQGLKNKL